MMRQTEIICDVCNNYCLCSRSFYIEATVVGDSAWPDGMMWDICGDCWTLMLGEWKHWFIKEDDSA